MKNEAIVKEASHSLSPMQAEIIFVQSPLMLVSMLYLINIIEDLEIMVLLLKYMGNP